MDGNKIAKDPGGSGSSGSALLSPDPPGSREATCAGAIKLVIVLGRRDLWSGPLWSAPRALWTLAVWRRAWALQGSHGSLEARALHIGGDEHVWHTKDVFNIKGGRHAKTIGLTREKKPEIYYAVRFGSILENVLFDPGTQVVDHKDVSLAENTRAVYPPKSSQTSASLPKCPTSRSRSARPHAIPSECRHRCPSGSQIRSVPLRISWTPAGWKVSRCDYPPDQIPAR